MNITKLKIDGAEVKFAYGISITEKLNKDLNIGSMALNKVEQLDIEPMDLVEITIEDTIHYFDIASIKESTARFYESETKGALYNYDIGLCSTTIELQRVLLPNKVITNRLTGSNKTINQVIDEYLSVYAPEITISTRLATRLGTIEVKEFSWNRPTLFEVLNDLLSIISCVIVLNVNTDYTRELDYLDLYDRTNEVESSFYSDKRVTQDVTSYTSSVEVEASNVYDDKALTKTPLGYVPKTTESYQLKTSNQEVVTQKGILSVSKCEVIFYATDINEQKFTLDIASRIVEKKVWDLLYISNAVSYVADTATKKYKRNYLYFEEGKNVIKGLPEIEENYLGYSGFAENYFLKNVIYWCGLEQGLSIFPDNITEFINNKIVFNIEYTTTDNVLFRVNKEYTPKHKSVLINAQTSSNVYANLLGKQQQEFVNRIGNKEMEIEGRVYNYDDIPELNSTIGDFILTERTYRIQQNIYTYVAKLSEHYSADNMYASINTKKRYTSLLESSSASICTHLNEKKIELTLNPYVDKYTFTDLSNYLAASFGKSAKLQGALLKTHYETEGSSPYFMLETTPYIIGNNIVITTRTQTNVSVGSKLDKDVIFAVEVRATAPTQYVDSNGEFKYMELGLFTEGGFVNEGIGFTALNSEDFAAQLTHEDACVTSSQYPEIEISQTYKTYDSVGVQNGEITYTAIDFTKRVLDIIANRYKDNGEITAENIQLSFSADDDVYFTDEFVSKNCFVLENDTTLQFAYSANLEYNSNVNKNMSWIFDSNVTVSNGANGIEFVTTAFFESFTSYGVFDSDNNLLIAVNSASEIYDIYFAEREE